MNAYKSPSAHQESIISSRNEIRPSVARDFVSFRHPVPLRLDDPERLQGEMKKLLTKPGTRTTRYWRGFSDGECGMLDVLTNKFIYWSIQIARVDDGDGSATETSPDSVAVDGKKAPN